MKEPVPLQGNSLWFENQARCWVQRTQNGNQDSHLVAKAEEKTTNPSKARCRPTAQNSRGQGCAGMRAFLLFCSGFSAF